MFVESQNISTNDALIAQRKTGTWQSKTSGGHFASATGSKETSPSGGQGAGGSGTLPLAAPRPGRRPLCGEPASGSRTRSGTTGPGQRESSGARAPRAREETAGAATRGRRGPPTVPRTQLVVSRQR